MTHPPTAESRRPAPPARPSDRTPGRPSRRRTRRYHRRRFGAVAGVPGECVAQTTEGAAIGLRARHTAVIFLVSLAGLLLEVGYTRIVSYKLWYYYTYLVIGLALLGIGSGGDPRRRVAAGCGGPRPTRSSRVVLDPRRRRASRRLPRVARVPVNTVAIWDYGTTALGQERRDPRAHLLRALRVVRRASASSSSTLLGRAGDARRRGSTSPTSSAPVSGCLLADPADLLARTAPGRDARRPRLRGRRAGAGAARPRCCVVLGARRSSSRRRSCAVAARYPTCGPRSTKATPTKRRTLFSDWGPVFRVDVVAARRSASRTNRCSSARRHLRLGHLGVRRRRRRRSTGTTTDPRALPFDVLGAPPDRELIIGSAGGNEILASLHFGATRHRGGRAQPRDRRRCSTDHFADYTGHLAERPEVDIHQGDGRSYLARSDGDVRPDLVRRARQLRGQQRGVVGCVRALGELPLHDGDDQGERSST